METDVLRSIWETCFVDRTMKQVLRDMLQMPDKGLIRLIRKRALKLTAKEILQSLRRLDVRINSPTTQLEGTTRPDEVAPLKVKKSRFVEAGQKTAASRRLAAGVKLADLIAAGLLVPPVRLFRRYKGHDLEAKLLADGVIEFQNASYDSCSTAAELARSTVTGRRMNTNGWSFWQCQDRDGTRTTLFGLRKRFLAMKGHAKG
jgi:hypothetical protein